MLSMHATDTAARTSHATFRAVVAFFSGGGEVVLTSQADAHLSDDDLMVIARHEAHFACIDFDSTDIRITEWTTR